MEIVPGLAIKLPKIRVNVVEFPRLILLALNIVIAFRVFEMTNFQMLVKILENIYLLFLGLFLIKRLVIRIISKNYRVTPMEVLFIVFLFIPVFSSITANFEYKQPFFFGMATMRSMYISIGAWLIYRWLKDHKITLRQLELALITVSWFSTLYFYYMSMFANIENYFNMEIAAANMQRGGEAYFRFSMAMVFFGIVYYFVRLITYKKFVYILGLTFFSYYLVFIRLDRSSILAVLIAISIFYIIQTNIKIKITHFIKYLIPLSIVLLLLIFFNNDIFDRYALMFEDLYSIIFKGETAVGRFSIRGYESDVAIRGFLEDPFVGKGKLSPTWYQGGFHAIYGLFYPTDVGLIGTLFLFGIIGTCIIYSQFIFVFTYFLKIKNKNNVFLQICFYYLIILLLDSFSNGYLYIYAAHTLTVIGIIYFIYETEKNSNLISDSARIK